MALVVAHRCLVIVGGNGSLPSSTPFLPRPKDDSSGSDDDGDQDNRGAASKDSNDEIMSTGTEVFQLLPIRANYRIHAINGCDWISG
jgi:hypothetical protein